MIGFAGAASAQGAAGGPSLGEARGRDSTATGQGANTAPEQEGSAQTSDQPAAQSASTQPSIQSSLGPYGDPGGIRAYLAARGITYSFTYIGETLGVAAGGQRRGSIYEGRLDAQFDADLDKILGWHGATLHANVYQIHGHGLSRYYLGNLFTTSGIEALSSTRLYELWLEQQVLDGKVAIRAGQLAADTEFQVSQYGALFVNSTFGWPAIAAANLPSGGPAYPLATPAVRVKWAPTDQLSFLGGVFDGNPAGPGPGDPQVNNRGGVEFRTKDPAFVIGEAAYSYNQGKDDPGLPGTVKLGAWGYLGRVNDQRFAIGAADAGSLLLADPTSSGAARRLRGNEGVYAMLDQMLYREASKQDQGLGFFVRVSASPNDRNPVGFYADGGFTYKGLIPGRPDDTAGISFAYARIGASARGSDLDKALLGVAGFDAIRSAEGLIEATYQAQVVPGFTIQPDVQYIFRPGGTQVNPKSVIGAVEKDAVVAGLRATIRY